VLPLLFRPHYAKIPPLSSAILQAFTPVNTSEICHVIQCAKKQCAKEKENVNASQKTPREKSGQQSGLLGPKQPLP
jgi:hypothetical protein